VNRRSLLGAAAATVVVAAWPRATSAAWLRPDRLAVLPPRYRQLLGLMAQGMTNQEIGAALVLSQSTVRHHIQAVLVTLNVGTRAAAIRLVRT